VIVIEFTADAQPGSDGRGKTAMRSNQSLGDLNRRSRPLAFSAGRWRIWATPLSFAAALKVFMDKYQFKSPWHRAT
jgi:hypothetical protein